MANDALTDWIKDKRDLDAYSKDELILLLTHVDNLQKDRLRYTERLEEVVARCELMAEDAGNEFDHVPDVLDALTELGEKLKEDFEKVNVDMPINLDNMTYRYIAPPQERCITMRFAMHKGGYRPLAKGTDAH